MITLGLLWMGRLLDESKRETDREIIAPNDSVTE